MSEEAEPTAAHVEGGALRIRRALLSVSDKTGLLDLTRALVRHGVALISTGGTATALRAAGLAVSDVATVTGFPEMLGGRVKTLHPHIFGGILARRNQPGDLAALAEHGIGQIDLVVVNLYPFEQAAVSARRLPEDALEQIDIGGPSLLRAAAKNFAGVAVLCEPTGYADFLDELERLGGAVSLRLRRSLAGQAFAHTSAYDLNVASAFGSAAPEALPDAMTLGGRKRMSLRYGENPHQPAAFYADPLAPRGLAAAKVLQGKALSFNNLLDLDGAWRLAAEIGHTLEALKTSPRRKEEGAEPSAACAIVKHATPCGVGVGEDSSTAYERARATDPVSAFGGVCVLTGAIDEDLVGAAAEHFLEVLAAPAIEDAAREVLARKKNLRVLELPREPPEPQWDAKRVAGGLLVQAADALPVLERSDASVVTGELTDDLWRALLLAWAVVKHVKSNAIVFGDRGGTLGIGAGQMSRVDAVDLAVRKAGAAGLNLAGSVVASDAFFPFRDGLDRAAEAGAIAAIHPGGSVRDAEVIAAAREHGMTLVHTGVRHFRH
ncbi:MAG: bifunctional phosphoribosylaminoimidazolecarboxamide formyltransferase/IMP cyclohydrolase [Gemmatimonadetes bacterium]|nr:bifunctional phosphoribosylaminoimidazolecarboxamide formyltransferase/IMP cyclohydrolase [Gemmatimonadota bacterium]